MKIYLNFFDPDGNHLDTVTLYANGLSSHFPRYATWVEVVVEEDGTNER